MINESRLCVTISVLLSFEYNLEQTFLIMYLKFIQNENVWKCKNLSRLLKLCLIMVYVWFPYVLNSCKDKVYDNKIYGQKGKTYRILIIIVIM